MFADTSLSVRSKATGGSWLVLWDDGTVGKVPARDVLVVRAADVIGPPGTTEAARGEKQMAFPGQAGLPRGLRQEKGEAGDGLALSCR